MEKLGHLIVACGGTGGHFYPALSVAREYCDRGGRATMLVSGKHAAEQREAAEQAGLAAREIKTVRSPMGLWELMLFPFRILSCRHAAKKVLDELSGDILLGMGSFAAVPPCWAWPWRRKPLVLHEGNSFMGWVNRLFAKRAVGIALSLPLVDESQLKGVPGKVTGMPLREAVIAAATRRLGDEERQEIFASFGLATDRKTMLVFGGSQGARAINELLAATAPRLADLRQRLQFVVLTGTDDNGTLKESFAKAGLTARIVRGDPEIQRCYQIADLTLCRAGASSICELALFQMPMILVPLPSAADNHQLMNAQMLEKAGAAKCLQQHLATPELLEGWLREWLDRPEEWAAMGRASSQFAHPDATKAVVDMLVEERG